MKNDTDIPPPLLFCLSQVVFMSTLQAVKVSPLIERVSDHKDFKKLLRTRTNVLVLYTKSGECQTYVLEYNAVSMAVFKHIYASSSLASLTIMTSMAFRGSVCTKDLHFCIPPLVPNTRVHLLVTENVRHVSYT